MTRIIPSEALDDFIKRVGWVPGQDPPQQPTPQTAAPISTVYSVDDFLRGEPAVKPFDDSSLPTALEQALGHAGSEGIVLTMPELMAAKVKANKRHEFWNGWYAVHTEEDIGIDQKGRFYGRNEPVLVVVHGGGILSPERIRKAYDDGLVSGSARYEQEEFDMLLEGKVSETLPLYPFEEVQGGLSLPHRYGVVIPYATAQATQSGYHKKKAFMGNPLVVARAGGMEHVEAYFNKAVDSDGKVRNNHPFTGRDASQAQGRVLFLNNNISGLVGDINLNIYGRFVGVAPEARGARK